MNWLVMLAFCAAYALGWYVRGPFVSAWWRELATTAQGRVKVLEGELAASRQTVATAQGVYLARLRRCEGCATCNPEPLGFDLTDHEPGDAP
jgi:hypothetical protein